VLTDSTSINFTLQLGGTSAAERNARSGPTHGFSHSLRRFSADDGKYFGVGSPACHTHAKVTTKQQQATRSTVRLFVLSLEMSDRTVEQSALGKEPAAPNHHDQTRSKITMATLSYPNSTPSNSKQSMF
jgi:hypothetical protein